MARAPEAAQVVLVRGPGRADHRDTALAGDLQHRRPDAAGRAADQQRLSGPHADLAEDAQRGLHHRRVPGRLVEGQSHGYAGPGRQHGEFGVRVGAFAEHAVADLDPFDALADLVHHPGGVQSDPGGQLDRMGSQDLALPNPPVDGVDAGCSYGDAYPAGARVGLLGFHQLQDFGTAELGETNFPHGAEHKPNR